jgi:poly(A) polymerase Pap1
VTEIQCIKDAKVPLMKFKFDGVSIDLPFAQLKVISVPQVGVKITTVLGPGTITKEKFFYSL